LGVLAGLEVSSISEMNWKLLGSACQINALFAPGVPEIRTMFRLKSVPEPSNGVKSFEKAEIRRALVVPGPMFRMLEETFQLLAVRPAPEVPTLWKLTTAESNLKSPWNPTKLLATGILVVVTGWVKLVTPVLTVATGSITEATTGVAVGVGLGVAVGGGVGVGEAVGTGEAVGVGEGVDVGVGVGVGPATQDANLKLPIRVLQLEPLVLKYSWVYQKVQSSDGSTVKAL
jgi:hypothetical protein